MKIDELPEKVKREGLELVERMPGYGGKAKLWKEAAELTETTVGEFIAHLMRSAWYAGYRAAELEKPRDVLKTD